MREYISADLLYPMKFTPIYQHRIWGGTQMTAVWGRQVPEELAPVGESWELVDRPEAQSVVENGAMQGVTLGELVKHYRENLLGPKGAKHRNFPLLVKLIDAGERLSLQVHPDEQACAKIGGGAEPKTEMWYVVAAEKGAQILGGLSGRATRLQVVDNLDRPEIENLMQVYPSQPGDAYFITAGTLHAIGGGNLILEIQQNSDTTYRVSDWGRVDAEGKSRELHLEKGLASIDFMNRTSPRITGVTGSAGHNRKYTIVSMCRHFAVDDLHLVTTWHDTTRGCGSFHLLSAVSGSFRISWRNGEGSVEAAPGETLLVPFVLGDYTIEPLPGSAPACRVVRTTL